MFLRWNYLEEISKLLIYIYWDLVFFAQETLCNKILPVIRNLTIKANLNFR